MMVVGAWLSLFERLQDRSWRGRLAGTSVAAPVFIVGHWRSGTTLLHELLCTNPEFAYPTTHACMNPQHFLWSSAGAIVHSDKVMARPMDGMAITPGSPQEDEFALLCLGCPSPYDAVLYPRSLPGMLERADPSTLGEQEQAEWESRFLAFVKGVQLLGSGRRLILKSPTHSLRIAALARLLPDARFIHIVRDPAAVYPSTLRMWRELMTAYAVGAPIAEADLRPAIRRIMVGLDDAVREAAADLGPQRYQRVHFEELAADPVAAIARLYRTLDLGSFDRVGDRIAASALLRRDHRVTGASLDPGERAALMEDCGCLFDRYGYVK
jgi:hypothetical protein